MEMDGLDEVYKHQRFLPTRQEAVGYFLRCLLTGETLNGAEKLIHRADIYACEPKDLAAEYPPVPTAVSSGDRFFFTTCRRNKNGYFARGAAPAPGPCRRPRMSATTWASRSAVVADGEKVLCRIHLANHPPAAARQESNAYKLRRQEGAQPAPAPRRAEPVTLMASAHAQKRPAPVAAADMSSCKKMRIAAPIPVPAHDPASAEEEYEDCPVWFTPTAPVSTLPAASMEAPEADEDTGRLSCSWEELFGEEQQDEQTLPVEHQVLDQGMEQLAAPIDWEQFEQSLFADEGESEVQHSEAPINWEQLFSDEEDQLVASCLAQLQEVEAEFQMKSCYQYN
ncbi:unnamed protein product [Alopecurus aequalis]